MNIEDFVAGSYRSAFQYKYFLPQKINHSYTWRSTEISELLEEAALKLGELNSFSRFVPDVELFIKMHVIKEAVVSNKIEGTQTNIEDAFFEEMEIEPEKRDDWQEVQNYVLAMNYAIGELKNLPLSNRLIRSTHKVLLSSVRGKDRAPGEFRISQNWIGGASLKDASFIPPVHTELPELLSDLELFLNNSEIKIPHLIRIAIAHYQFETIHPFLDGNGRIGRLLISLYLVSNGILEKPLLYLSDFFERNKTLYYDNLTNVRHKNDLVQWIKFFLVGVLETADKSSITLRNILELKSDLEKNKIMKMGKRATKGSALLQYLFSGPVVNGKLVGSILQLSPKATNLLIQEFLEANILVETTGNSRNKSYIFEKYLMMF